MRLAPLLLASLFVAACASPSDDATAPPTSDRPGSPDAPPGPTTPGPSTEPSIAPPAAPGTITVGVAPTETRIVQGSSAKLRVEIGRGAGLESAPVEVKITGLPASVVASPVIIPAGETRADVEVVAAVTAEQGPSEATVAATAGDVAATPAKAALFVRGAPGSLDTTWGTKGIARFVTTFGMYCRPSRVLPDADGSAVVLGYGRDAMDRLRLCAVRLDRKGNLDPTFVNDHVGPPNGVSAAHAGARLTDGRFLAFMEGFAIRLQKDGRLDDTYGTAGRLTMPEGTPAAATTAPNGAVVTVHALANGVRVTRFTPDGALDTTFGTGGATLVVTPSAPSSFEVGIVVGADGHVAGYVGLTTAQGFSSGSLAFFRLTGAGALDGTLGPNGVRVVSFTVPSGSVYEIARGLHERADGSLVAAARASTAQATTTRFLGVTKAGGADVSLGPDGFSAGVSDARSHVVSSGNDILTLEGQLSIPVTPKKWTSTGTVLATFAATSVPSFTRALDAVTLTDRLWLLGTSDDPTPPSRAVVRVWN